MGVLFLAVCQQGVQRVYVETTVVLNYPKFWLPVSIIIFILFLIGVPSQQTFCHIFHLILPRARAASFGTHTVLDLSAIAA